MAVVNNLPVVVLHQAAASVMEAAAVAAAAVPVVAAMAALEAPREAAAPAEQPAPVRRIATRPLTTVAIALVPAMVV